MCTQKRWPSGAQVKKREEYIGMGMGNKLFQNYRFHSKTIVFIPKLSFLFQKNQSKNDQFQDYCCHSKTLAFPNFENDCFKKYCFPERPFLKQLLRFFFLKNYHNLFSSPSKR